MMEGQCKERLAAEEAEGERRERPEQVTTRTRQDNSESKHSDRTKKKYADVFFCMTCIAEY